MEDPQQYSRANSLQRRDARAVLDEWLGLVRWRSRGGDAVLDVGCGAGDVTAELLRPRLPRKVGRLLATDVSDDMVKHAQSTFPDIEFATLDIADPHGPPDNFKMGFDHIFSFYCLHWVQDQRQAMQNIYDLLRPGGDMLVTFLASNPIYDIYLNLAAMERWRPYLQDVQRFVSPYHQVTDVEGTLMSLLQDVGFSVRLCTCTNRQFQYDNINVAQKSMKAVNPFFARMDDTLKDQFVVDYINELRKLNLVEENNNGKQEKIVMTYRLVVLCASKPT